PKRFTIGGGWPGPDRHVRRSVSSSATNAIETSMKTEQRPASPTAGSGSKRPGLVTGVSVGLITAGAAVGVAQLAAAFVGELASPMGAVGEAVIDLSPRSVRD